MKKTLTLLTLGIFLCLSAFAQNQEDVNISNKGDKFAINVAGFQIGFENDTTVNGNKVSTNTSFEVIKKSRSQFSFDLLGPFYHGWNTPIQSEYYGDWAGKGDFLQYKRAFSFGMTFCRFSFALDPKHSVKINLSGRWDFTRYHYENSILLLSGDDGVPYPYDFYEKTKSKVFSSYVGLPFGLSYEKDGFKIAANITAEWLVDSYAKYCGEKTKYVADGFNHFRSNVELVVSYGLIGAYASYSLTPVLTKGLGNDAHTLTIGFVFGLNL